MLFAWAESYRDRVSNNTRGANNATGFQTLMAPKAMVKLCWGGLADGGVLGPMLGHGFRLFGTKSLETQIHAHTHAAHISYITNHIYI
jgi:hypothetical protein